MARRRTQDNNDALDSAAKVKAKPQGTAANGKAPKAKGRKRRFRGAFGRTIMKVPRLRRFYLSRLIKTIDRYEKKGRALPKGLEETARFLSRVPKAKRLETLDKAIQVNEDMPNMGREMRRAASRQRRSGQSDFHYRPGSAPGTFKQAGGRKPKVR
ncbi:MAG TPA: hypothetical protein VFN61_16440 [Acidimicrobiales bacterium]|nr:hypothetical protein [Acidimicrobiales bacterium]